MEYRTFDQLRRVADVHAAEQRSMSRRERLERWAEVLEREPSRRLLSLGEIECKTKEERQVMRADNSPLTVAFHDPILRAEGLTSDRLGDAPLRPWCLQPRRQFFICSGERARIEALGSLGRSDRGGSRAQPKLSAGHARSNEPLLVALREVGESAPAVAQEQLASQGEKLLVWPREGRSPVRTLDRSGRTGRPA